MWLTKAYFPDNENMIPYKSHEGLNSSFFSHQQTLEAHPVFFSKYITLMNSYYEILQFQWTLVETFHVLLLGCKHFRNSKLVCFFYISQCLNNKTESRKNKHNKWDGKIDSSIPNTIILLFLLSFWLSFLSVFCQPICVWFAQISRGT